MEKMIIEGGYRLVGEVCDRCGGAIQGAYQIPIGKVIETDLKTAGTDRQHLVIRAEGCGCDLFRIICPKSFSGTFEKFEL